nr:hypothetical protein [Tanacetum cinerariifolium]
RRPSGRNGPRDQARVAGAVLPGRPGLAGSGVGEDAADLGEGIGVVAGHRTLKHL